MWKKISQAHNLMPAFSDEEQHCDKPVNVQPLAIIWQPFLACTLSVLLTPGHWGQLEQISITSADPVTCWSAQRQQDVVLLWACFVLSKITNTVQALTCSSCCQICYNWQMQWAHQNPLLVSRISGWQHQSTPTAKNRRNKKTFEFLKKTGFKA